MVRLFHDVHLASKVARETLIVELATVACGAGAFVLASRAEAGVERDATVC